MLGGFTIIVIGLLVLWVSCRGKFMFLDNLVHQRSEISRPWTEFAAQGDSLFLWLIFYMLISLAILGFSVLLGFAVFVPLMAGDVSWVVTAPLVIVAGTISFIFMLAIMFIDFFLTAYVVPIMHKERTSCMQAWSRFLTLFREHPGSFILSGLFYLVVSISGILGIMIVGVMTCCIGLILMAIPYVGSVILLPYTVTLRYLTLDFLGQFGDEFSLLEPVVDKTNPSTQFNDHRTVIGTEDISGNGSGDEPGPQDGRD